MPRRARLTPATMVAETTVGRLVKEKGQGEASPLVGGRVPLFLLNPGCHWEWQSRAGAEVDQGGADKPETFPGGGPEVEPQRPLGRRRESKAWRPGGLAAGWLPMGGALRPRPTSPPCSSTPVSWSDLPVFQGCHRWLVFGWAAQVGVGVPSDSQSFPGWCQGQGRTGTSPQNLLSQPLE